MSWLHRAACRDTDPEWFFPIDSAGSSPASREALERARAVCRTCPVRDACLAWALETRQVHGVWAGTTPEARRALRRRREIAPKRGVDS